jgi:hypothetical protein
MDYGSMGPASKKAGPWRTLDGRYWLNKGCYRCRETRLTRAYLARRSRVGYSYLEYLRCWVRDPALYYLQRTRLHLCIVQGGRYTARLEGLSL